MCVLSSCFPQKDVLKCPNFSTKTGLKKWIKFAIIYQDIGLCREVGVFPLIFVDKYRCVLLNFCLQVDFL